ncbi:MAG: aminotransferase class IV [Ignavibacteriales bacterium]|nr:aminotransferase class IV [Ignavibacteriales bacterium]
MNKSRKDLLGCTDFIDLREQISIPKDINNDVFKCRVLYSREIEQIQFIPYTLRQIRTIKIVECDTIEYYYKFVDRKILGNLMDSVETDDILIIKNGMVTDTSFSNIVFFDGTKWVTPDTPLLRGIKRTKLMKEKIIFEQSITKNGIQRFEKAALINAMVDIKDSPIIEIQNIF